MGENYYNPQNNNEATKHKARKHRPVHACTECKQVKLRCDAKARYPGACSRCQTRKLSCVVDADFRRTPTRERISQMERELQNLRRSAKRERRSAESPGEAQTTTHADGPWCSVGQFGASADFFSNVQPVQLGRCTLSAEDVIFIFSTFSTHFHVHLPILDPSMTIASIYKTNKFLFWTIVVIVVQRISWYSQGFSNLLEPYETLLGREAISSPLPLLSIQGLLFISTWPLPVYFQKNDKSWNLSCLAINGAKFIGLNQLEPAEAMQSIGFAEASPMRSATWLACFHVSIWLSQSAGLEPPIRAPEDIDTIDKMMSDDNVPRHFAGAVAVSRCVAKYSSMLSKEPKGSIPSFVARLYEEELDRTKATYQNYWSGQLQGFFLQAKLQIYAHLAVNESHNHVSEEHASPGSHNGLLSHHMSLSQGFNTATDLIDTITASIYSWDATFRSGAENIPSRRLFMGGCPKDLFRGSVLAAFFLLRYFTGSNSASEDMRRIAHEKAMSMHDILKWFTIRDNEETTRAAALIAGLAQAPTPHEVDDSVTLKVHDRGAASLNFHALAKAKELHRPLPQMENSAPASQRDVGIRSPPTSVSLEGGSPNEAELPWWTLDVVGNETGDAGGNILDTLSLDFAAQSNDVPMGHPIIGNDGWNIGGGGGGFGASGLVQ